MIVGKKINVGICYKKKAKARKVAGIPSKYMKACVNLILAIVIVAVCIYIAPKIILLLMPFILGWFLAALSNPLVRFFEEKMRIIDQIATAEESVKKTLNRKLEQLNSKIESKKKIIEDYYNKQLEKIENLFKAQQDKVNKKIEDQMKKIEENKKKQKENIEKEKNKKILKK